MKVNKLDYCRCPSTPGDLPILTATGRIRNILSSPSGACAKRPNFSCAKPLTKASGARAVGEEALVSLELGIASQRGLRMET